MKYTHMTINQASDFLNTIKDKVNWHSFLDLNSIGLTDINIIPYLQTISERFYNTEDILKLANSICESEELHLNCSELLADFFNKILTSRSEITMEMLDALTKDEDEDETNEDRIERGLSQVLESTINANNTIHRLANAVTEQSRLMKILHGLLHASLLSNLVTSNPCNTET
jgi:hypothetical protein